MIELKNISKTYRSKKGTSTNALVDVSLSFDEKGMTFILGKSGSGKSTLLNILGGLDKYDSGDMLILNKSSKDFTQADFDSYRNTYIGFVFQEFNILEDYDIYENIVLALQLQQKEIKIEEIDSLLEKLGLKELKHRKVNELSGGQKQRVAIARALIKNPKIILADEPTGNLDSNTSKEVMNLLKEISKEKLVIVVSHDVESANTYGDRIIEIQDGKVVKDTKKTQIENHLSENYVPIKSHLPWKEGFKLGLGSLRHKKIKLAFTILLTVFSLLFLSVTDTLSSYNINLAHAKLLKDKKEELVQVEKYYWSEDYSYSRENLSFNEKELEEVESKIKQDFSRIYRIRLNDYGYENYFSAFRIDSSLSVYSTNDGSLEIVEDDTFSYVKKQKLIGRLPEEFNEVVISNMIADDMIKNGVIRYGEEDAYFPNDYDDILNSEKDFYFTMNGKVKIVGIIDYDISKYKKILETDDWSKYTDEDYANRSEYSAKQNHIYNKIFVKKGFTSHLNTQSNEFLNRSYRYMIDLTSLSEYVETIPFQFSNKDEKIQYYDGTTWKSISDLKENEIVISISLLDGYDWGNYYEEWQNYQKRNKGKEESELEKEFLLTYYEKLEDVIGKKVTLDITSLINDKDKHSYSNMTIAGIVLDMGSQTCYVPYNQFKSYETNMIQVTGVMIDEPDYKEMKKLMDTFPFKEHIALKSAYSEDVSNVVRIVDLLKQVAFYVAIVFIIFTIVLLTNFMFSSISYRKREIGILRGLGASSRDTVKIFLWEGIVLATISFILSSIGLVLVTNLLNTFFMEAAVMILTPFIITIRQFIVMLLIVYGIIIIASILPIRKIAKMKPIDAILKK